MISIAFCDDDPAVLGELRTFLDKYRAERNRELDYVAFRSPLDLLFAVEKGARYDILFLDILMPGETGMDTAAEIRKYDTNMKIIFLTSSSEFAVQSYTVGAYYYQLKPLCEEGFFRLLDFAVSACEREQSDSLVLRCKTGIARVELRYLEYCEVIHRTLFLHLADGRVLESIGTLDELSRQLEPYGGFFRLHRSYLVNLAYVQNLSYRAVTLSCGAEIPVPRGRFQEVKETYLAYAFRNRQVVL